MSHHVDEVESEHVESLLRIRCQKSYDHDKFIATPDFQLSHIPEYVTNKQYVLDFVRKWAKCTVRIKNNKPGSNRPREFGQPGAGELLGTGIVVKIEKRRDLNLVIYTCAHVVCSQEEVENTRVMFFYEKDNDMSNVVKAQGVKILAVSREFDFCMFVCRLVNDDDRDKVICAVEDIDGLQEPEVTDLAILVSHPHGLAQRISIGKVDTHTGRLQLGGRKSLNVLLHHCCVEDDIDVEKVLYFYLNEVFSDDTPNPVVQELSTFLFFHKDTLVFRLAEKGLICKPSEDERRKIIENNNSFNITLEQEYGRLPDLDDDEMERRKNMILDNLLFDIYPYKLKNKRRYKELEACIINEIYKVGEELGFTEINRLYVYVKHTIPSCGGSSGGIIFSFKEHFGGVHAGANVNAKERYNLARLGVIIQ